MQHGQIRIIGGQWRGRKLRVPEIPGLRPTPDRVRETLFNWLQPVIADSYCLDLFAGTGALSFEALSRGAKYATIIDQSPFVVTHLKEQLKLFKSTSAAIYCAKIPQGLKSLTHPADIIFLDPPFKENLLLPTIQYLEAGNFLAENAYIYLESATPISQDALPATWHLLKQARAGQVCYHLAIRNPEK